MCFCVVLLVPEEAEPPGACGRGGKTGAKAALRQETRHQGRLQGNHEENCAKGGWSCIVDKYYFSTL